MVEIRDFGIAVSDAIRLNDCFHELTEHLTARPPCEGDAAMWRTKASASPGNEDWVHRTNSRDVAEILLRKAILGRQFDLWVRLQDSELAIDSYAMKDVAHRSLAAGAYLETNESQSFLSGRPLWIKLNDWQRTFSAIVQDRYGAATKLEARDPDTSSGAFNALLEIWRQEAVFEHNTLMNKRQADLGSKGLTGGSDYVGALCRATFTAINSALNKAKAVPASAQNLSIVSTWSLCLFDELAVLARDQCKIKRLRLQSNGPLADRLHADGRAAIERELTKWKLEAALPQRSAAEVSGVSIVKEKGRATVNPVGDGPLRRWWQKIATASETMTQAEILDAAKAAFPNQHVSRQRIRDLTGARKTGPKPISRKDTAK